MFLTPILYMPSCMYKRYITYFFLLIFKENTIAQKRRKWLKLFQVYNIDMNLSSKRNLPMSQILQYFLQTRLAVSGSRTHILKWEHAESRSTHGAIKRKHSFKYQAEGKYTTITNSGITLYIY